MSLFAPSFAFDDAANDDRRERESDDLIAEFAETLAASLQANDVAATNDCWTRLILADKDVCAVAPIKRTVLYGAKDDAPRTYAVRLEPPKPEPPQKQEERDAENATDETPRLEKNGGNLRRPGFFNYLKSGLNYVCAPLRRSPKASDSAQTRRQKNVDAPPLETPSGSDE